MPNIKSAIKRMRSDAKRNERNQKVLAELKTLDIKLRKLGSDPKKAGEVAKTLSQRYDQAASSGAVPRGRADRKKSRIAAFVARISK